MSMLAALTRAYERLPDRPRLGYSLEKIGFAISLHADGSVASVADLRASEGKKKTPRLMLAPQPVKRTVAVAPNLLWDKTAYALGVTAGEGKRTAQEHAAFVARHEALLADETDEGLRALLAFLRDWTPARFEELGWSAEMKDANIVFALESDRLDQLFLHDRPAAQALVARAGAAGAGAAQICLVTGTSGPVARLHPSIKGVKGAQTAGAALVSFNLGAFESYGHQQGDNAPVGEYAAFAYTTALNRFLARDSGHRLQMGETTVVFWADAEDKFAREGAELFLRAMLDPPAEADDAERAREEADFNASVVQEIGDKLRRMARGESLAVIEPRLETGVRFHVLGLAPNAARLAARFYFEDEFGVLARNYRDYLRDVAIEPWPGDRPLPSLRRMALRTAPAMRDKAGKVKFDADAMSPLLTGELLRAALTGARFPTSLLSLLLMRLRGDQYLDPSRIALIKAVVVRNLRLDGDLPPRADQTPDEEYLMRSDPDDPNEARRLGRLFAIIERCQRYALGDRLSASVADKFLAAACATPERVFTPLLIAASTHHIKRLKNGHSDYEWIKESPAPSERARKIGFALETTLGKLAGQFKTFPAQHSTQEQGLFLIGYYQERWGRTVAAAEDADVDTHETNEESAS